MTRGWGSLQCRVMAALESRCAHDFYDATVLSHELDGLCSPVRARWRWYSIDLLGLVGPHPRDVERATLLAAIRGLARREQLDTIRTAYPYTDPFHGYLEDGRRFGHVDLAELCALDSRWPTRHGRRLWFRRRPPSPAAIPPDDQISVLARLHVQRPDAFEDFAGLLDRKKAWTTPTGQFLAWLLCGNMPVHLGREVHTSRPNPDQHRYEHGRCDRRTPKAGR